MRDIIYYGLPIIATLFICAKISPKMGNDLKKGRINIFFLLVVIAVGAVMFIINSFLWATLAFFVIRG